jgi:hypothetical protein
VYDVAMHPVVQEGVELQPLASEPGQINSETRPSANATTEGPQ